MKKHSAIFSFLFSGFVFFNLLTCTDLQAAGRFVRGYVVTTAGDTLNGKISYQNYQNCYKECLFYAKKTSRKNAVKYRPNEIKAFGYNQGREYFSTNLPGTDSLVFMESLFQGLLKVYLWSDSLENKRFFIQKDTFPVKELKYTSEFVLKDGQDALKVWNNYPSTLHFYLSDCPVSIDLAYTMEKPNERELISIARTYHKRMTGVSNPFPKRQLLNNHTFVEVSIQNQQYSESTNMQGYYQHSYDREQKAYQLMCYSEMPDLIRHLYWGVGYNTQVGVPLALEYRPVFYYVQPALGVSVNYLPGFNHLFSTSYSYGLNLKISGMSVGIKHINYHPFHTSLSDIKTYQLSIGFYLQ